MTEEAYLVNGSMEFPIYSQSKNTVPRFSDFRAWEETVFSDWYCTFIMKNGKLLNGGVRYTPMGLGPA